MKTHTVLTSLLTILLISAIGRSQEISHSVLEAYPERIRARIQMRDKIVAQRLLELEPDGLEAIFTVGKTWPTGRTITVAFRGGNTALHKKIAETANAWSEHGNFKFDFGFDGEANTYRTWASHDQEFAADIRIAFNFRGLWSLVGTDSRNELIVRPGDASMNLGRFARRLPADWQATVLHEFGHALGLQHEHQHPKLPCDFRWDDDWGYEATTDQFGQFDADDKGRRPGIYTVLGGPPNEWSKEQVDHNLRALPNSSAFKAGPFDRDSIMKYYFEAWMFKRGGESHCFTGRRNGTLSVGDEKAIAEAYPPDSETAAVHKVAASQQQYKTLMVGMKLSPQPVFEVTPHIANRVAMGSEADLERMTSEYRTRMSKLRPTTAELDSLEGTAAKQELKLSQLIDQPRNRQEIEERVIRAPNFLPADFIVTGARRQATVGRISFKATFSHPVAGTFFPGDGWGTGFLVAPTILMTNNHVLEEKDFSRSKVRIEFNFQRLLDSGLLGDADSYDFDPDDFFYTNEDLDFTLVRVKRKPVSSAVGAPLRSAGNVWGSYNLSDSKHLTDSAYFEKMRLNIVQHPAGRPKEVAIHQNHLDRLFGNHVRYTTDTEGGSSGSPVFDNRWILVALHHRAGEKDASGNWKNNQGVRIDKIILDIESANSIPIAVKSELGLQSAPVEDEP